MRKKINRKNRKDVKDLKIVSLNVQGSLQSRLADIEKDKSIMVSDIICLQETGTSTVGLGLEGYKCFNAGGGKNKGVAIYVKDDGRYDVEEAPEQVENNNYQGLKLNVQSGSAKWDLITIYLANGQSASSMEG